MINLYTEFKSFKKHGNSGIGIFCRYLLFKKKYALSVDDFFAYGFDTRLSVYEYANINGYYAHGWCFNSRAFVPGCRESWYVWHFLDYRCARFIYKGLSPADYFKYAFYNFRHCKRRTFITEGGLHEMAKRFNGQADTSVLADKSKFNTAFHDYIGRKWISSDGISFETFRHFCSSFTKVIVKPTGGGMGQGVFIAEVDDENKIRELYEKISDRHCLVEEIIVQHSKLSEINFASVNTIRIVSIVKDYSVNIVGAYLRIGNGKQPTDNYSSGGMVSVLDIDSGIVCCEAKDKVGVSYLRHPVSGVKILGFEVPHWDKIISTVREAHMLIPEIRYIGWDISVTDEGNVVFVEGNSCACVDFCQQLMLSGKKQLYESLF